MSKISGITDNTHIFTQPQPGRADKDAFRQALENSMGREADQIGNGGSTSLGEIQAPAVNMIRFTSENTVSEMANKTDSLLGLLENYSRELENPEKSLRELEPMISEIRQNAEDLLAQAQESGPEPGIRRLAGQAAATANIEYIKFQRGDYI